MKFILFILVLFPVIASQNGLTAQPLKENEIVVIHGEKYILHQVRTGETVYSISRQFQVEGQELFSHNPQIAEGLKMGEILKIPYRENADWQEIPVSKKGDPDYFEQYTITSRTQTPYFIAKEFGITVEEIYSYNPEISRFRKGTQLRIPRWREPAKTADEEWAEKPTTEEKQEPNLVMHEVQPGETLYSLARRYKLSESEILFFNPGAKELKAGSVIYLPVTNVHEKIEESQEQTVNDDPEFTMEQSDRADYFEHTIISGETLWSLTRKYDVSEEELKRLNPILNSGFPAGAAIQIPVREKDLVKAEPVHEDAFLEHQVQAGETLFGLASQYNLTIPEIRRFNPQLENRNLVRGERLLIPRQPEEETLALTGQEHEDSLQVDDSPLESEYYRIEIPTLIPENCQVGNSPFLSSAKYEVALFLPLFIHANDTLNRTLQSLEIPADSLMFEDEIIDLQKDTLVEMDEPQDMFHGFYRESENYLQFYEGVLLAVDSLQRAGMNIRLNVIDTQQNPDSIREHIYTQQFLETDLIIGPVYAQVQEEVASIAAKNRIPMISPLSSISEELDSNPYYFQVNPTRDFLTLETAELLEEEYFNSNFIVINTAHSNGLTEGKVVDLIREKMTYSGYWGQSEGMDFKMYDFSSDGPFGLSRLFTHGKENVVFVSSMNEGDLSVILSNINNLAEEYSITLVGFNRYEQFHSISKEFFHNLKLQYITPYWTDYQNPETIRILEKFKAEFKTEPNNFGMQGYDVSFYFLSAMMRFGKDFRECLPYHHVQLAQGNYLFEKVSEYGGYMNQGVSVISYRRNYDVVRKRVLGTWRYAQY
jgi:LysM repeat protein/ABC-type branched-subunit amino acid transport system substrate-binding protein